MTKVHESYFRLLKGKKELGLYEWNTHIAKHHFCKQCGIYTFHRKRVSPEFFGINVYCLDNVDISKVPIIEVDGIMMSVEQIDQ